MRRIRGGGSTLLFRTHELERQSLVRRRIDDQIGTVALDGMSLSFTYYVSSSGSYSGSFGVCIASWFIGTTTPTLFSQCYSSSQVSSMCGYNTWCTMSVEISGDGDDGDDATYDDGGACEGHGHTQTECEAIK